MFQNTVVPLLRGHPIRQRKVASQKGWPLKRGINASENLLNMAIYVLDGAKKYVKCVLLQKITG
jgi:hypothetical protein